MGKHSAAEAMDVSMNDTVDEGPTTDKEEYERLCGLVNGIAQPLAGRKLAKKLYKLVKKSSKKPQHLRMGLKDIQKAIRKNEKGMLILAGNVTPIDVYSHLPALCEEKELPYCYTPSREHLGLAAGHRRPAIAMFIKSHSEYQELYDEVSTSMNQLVVNVE